MFDRTLYDDKGRKIGEFHLDRRGRHIGRDAEGRKVGEYDPESDATWDATGRKVGDGNRLAELISGCQA